MMVEPHYTDEQIAFVLKQVETGTPVFDILERMRVSKQTYEEWEKIYAGLGVVDLRRLKFLENENRRLRDSITYLHID